MDNNYYRFPLKRMDYKYDYYTIIALYFIIVFKTNDEKLPIILKVRVF